MTQAVEGLFFDLADPLTGDIKTLADLFEGLFGLLANAEAQPDNLFFPFTER